MTSVEIEVLKNHLAVKIGVLEMKIQSGEIDSRAQELILLYKEYEHKGTTLEELNLLFSDVLLELGESL